MYCGHIFKSRERFAINDFFKSFNKYHSQYFLIIYKKKNKKNPATAKLYILTTYILEIYNAATQRDRKQRKNKKTEGVMPAFTMTLFGCFNLSISAF